MNEQGEQQLYAETTDDIRHTTGSPDPFSTSQSSKMLIDSVMQEMLLALRQLAMRPPPPPPPTSVQELTMLLQWLEGRQEAELRALRSATVHTLAMRLELEREGMRAR